MKQKHNKERFTRETEASLDKEFKKLGLTTYVAHIHEPEVVCFPADPFIITVVTTTEAITREGRNHLEEVMLDWYGEGAQRMGSYLAQKTRHPGISICAPGDNFNRREGRIRAKRRLISHLINNGVNAV